MKNRIITTLFLGLTTLVCSGQSFLLEYPKLTKKNLSEFFLDWKAYSDSIALKATKNDSLIDEIVCTEYAPMLLEGRLWMTGKDGSPQYFVFPQYIKVERYYIDVDTVMAKHEFGFPSFIPDIKDNQYIVDSITPILPHGGLYLTSDINKTLSIFVGGLKRGDKIAKINKRNVGKLEKYIPVDYGHWGGYWWFTSFPLITNICYANNLIAVMRRTSWCTGDVIWYVKENGKFVRYPEPIVDWME